MSLWDRVKVDEYEDSAGSDVFHIRVSDPIAAKYRGFGSDRTKDQALVKAISEFCERAAMFTTPTNNQYRFSSSGFAAHQTSSLASSAAIAELLERDMVMCSWLARRPPRWIPESLLPSNLSVFKKFGLKCLVGHLGQTGNIQTYISILISNKRSDFGCTFAASSGTEFESCLDTLFFNQRRNLTLFLSSNHSALTNRIDASSLKTPESHRTYYLNPGRGEAWKWILASAESPIKFEDFEHSVESIAIPFETPWDLHVARASSVHLQNYFVGVPDPKFLNLKRLGEFGITSMSEIYMEPHPLP